ncbi:MAG: 3'-5' exonuclease [bacterium]|nr:3'-5' exonuclease [bacterium]
MLKAVKDRVWAFDLEWIPDPLAGQILYDLPETSSARETMQRMWQEGGASEEDPTPFLKLIRCRIVSIAALTRQVRKDGEVVLNLTSLPHDPDDAKSRREAEVIGPFMDAIGEQRPQLVGYNSLGSDLKILVQRGVVLGLRAPGFCERPNKPWEGIDYFARGSDWNIDLQDMLGGFGKSVPSLHEFAVQSGIPGKMEVDGNQVAALWLDGDHRKIVQYNEFDAVTTYLVWLRVAHFSGHFSDHQYEDEQKRVRDLLNEECKRPERAHLMAYQEEWERLQNLVLARQDPTG